MRDDDANSTSPTHSYHQNATQDERRAVLAADIKAKAVAADAAALRAGDREPTTYAAIAEREDDLGQRPAAVPKYPVGPAWSRDLASLPKEEPLGVDVNW